MKWRSPPNSDAVAFGGIGREVPIYDQVQTLYRELCKRSLYERGEAMLTSSAKIRVVKLMAFGRPLKNNKNRRVPITDP